MRGCGQIGRQLRSADNGLTDLAVMSLLRDPPALAAQIALQVRALTRAEVPVVGAVAQLLGADARLLRLQVHELAPRELARAQALPQARLLRALARVDGGRL